MQAEMTVDLTDPGAQVQVTADIAESAGTFQIKDGDEYICKKKKNYPKSNQKFIGFAMNDDSDGTIISKVGGACIGGQNGD